jgi:hypothetical protein
MARSRWTFGGLWFGPVEAFRGNESDCGWAFCRETLASMATLTALLEKGYFPRELPPPFHTSSFSPFAITNGQNWRKTRWTRCASHNLARPGGLRRPLKIPNPISYLPLAELISANWAQLRHHTWSERLSASRPHVMKSSQRAIIPRYRYGELPRLRALRRRGARYFLRTDISQFYPSLYTHTIPWALHTKQACKTALSQHGRGNNLLGNAIDRALQCMNEGQTHGIPIGPDSSLMAAEILLCAADAELLRRCSNLIRGFRYVDDYELSFGTLRDAEQVLMELQGILTAYELNLNPRKTRVEELPKSLESSWGIELGKYALRDNTHAVGQRNDLVSMFSRAFEIASEHPEESVLKYALARVQNENVHAGAWRAFHNCVLDAVGADPSTLAMALGALHQVSTLGGHTIPVSPLADVFEGVIQRHASRGEGSEVSWALWGALAWSIPLSNDAAASVSTMEDNVVALLAMDLNMKGLFPSGSLNLQRWIGAVSQPDALMGENWLLAYEGNQKGWLSTPAVTAEPEFAAMSIAGISFYDLARNTPQFPSAARSLPGGLIPDHYA